MYYTMPPHNQPTKKMLRIPVFLLLLLLLFPVLLVQAQTAPAGVVLSLSNTNKLVYVTYSASTWSNNLKDLALYMPQQRDGCSETGIAPPPLVGGGNWISVLERGGTCNFAAKVRAAQQAGASAVIIVNTKKAIYNFTGDGRILSPCWLRCDVAQAKSKDECEQNSKCTAGCGSTTTYGDVITGSSCCFNGDGLLDMSLGEFKATIPAMFASIEDGENIIIPAATSTTMVLASLRLRQVGTVDGSIVVLGLLAVCVLLGATYRAVSMERNRASWTWKQTDGHFLLDDEMVAASDEMQHPDNVLEKVDISPGLVVVFICVATCSIIVLFFLVQYYPVQVVIALQVFFALGTMGSFSFVFVQPLLRRILGTEVCTRVRRVKLPAFLHKCAEATEAEITLQDLVGIVVGGIFSWTWFICRHESWAWILLNLLAASLVCSFLLVIRLPSYKVACGLLCAFFFYDVFMVFITPLLFGGKSVMVEVATAGKGGENVSKDGQVCERRETESVPMLFLIPHFESWPGGYSLLGLGDIIMPGLLICLVLRFDYARSQRAVRAARLPTSFLNAHRHWLTVCFAYAFGLFLTFYANVSGWTFNGVRGQPALMYLVPSCLLAVTCSTLWTKDFMALWRSDWVRWEKGDFLAGGGGEAARVRIDGSHRDVSSTSSIGAGGQQQDHVPLAPTAGGGGGGYDATSNSPVNVLEQRNNRNAAGLDGI